MLGPIKSVAIYVDDQQKAVEFYTQKLGFTLRRSLAMGPHLSWIEVSPPGAQSCLVLYPKSMMANWAELKPSIVFQCAEVEETCRELEARGVRITMPPTSLGWGMFAKIMDLDGNELGLTSQAIA